MQPQPILILGAGGNSLAIADAIIAINAASPAQPRYELVGFLDDLPENQAQRVLGAGCSIMANSVICSGAHVHDHVIMLQNSSINHHSRLGKFVTVSAGVTVLGCVEAGENAFLSGGSSVAPYVKIGAGALVGLGSVVIRDVAPGTVVAGNPARELTNSRYALKP